MPLRARGKLACRIAGLEPQKLNEAAHFGHLPCVPETRPGAARVFEIDDIVMLSVFSELTRNGMIAPKAGKVACAIHKALVTVGQGRAKTARFYFPPPEYDDLGFDYLAAVSLFADDAAEQPLVGGASPDALARRFGYKAAFIHFPVAEIRDDVVRRLEAEDNNRVVGEDMVD